MKKLKVIFCLLLLIVVISLNVQVKAAEQLPDNGAKISSAQIIQTKTGTGPWDENDEPGNDSSEENDIVRSFDQVTWTLENTMTVTDGAEGYNGGTIYFEAKLPNSLNKQTAKWDVDSMAWIKNPHISSDGLTLTGTYELDSAALTVPGKQTLVLVLSIMGAPNGTTFQPTIKTWLNGNAESDYVTTIPDNITVSAVPNYNVMLVRNGNLAKKVTLNYGEGDTLGRIYGYSLALQLYNSQQSKGLKGIEYPQGNITMDVDMLLERSEFESEDLEDITDEVTPVLWNYHIAENTTNGAIYGRRMNFGNSYHTYEPALPYGKRTSLRIDSVYNSGNMSMVQDGRTLHVTFNNYDFDGVFPNDAYGYSGKPHVSIKYTSNIGFFSIGYFQVFIPNKEATTMEDRNYYLTLTDTNYRATSVSGTETTTQMITTDDSNRVQHVLYKPGSYSHQLFFYKWNGTKLTTDVSDGNGYVFLGQKIYVNTKFSMNITNDDDVYTAEKFVKFDGSAFEPIYMDDGSRYKVRAYAGDMRFNVYYVTKPDGTNWASQAEMNAANIENMNVYDSIEDIPADKICVGVYYESIEGGYLAVNTGDNNVTYFPLKVRENAEIGKTYGFVQNTRVWIEQLDRSVYNIKGNYSSYPRQTWQWKNQNYIKTEYNEDGTIKSGTHNGGWQWGNTLLVIGADQTIEIDPIDKADQSTKVNYDIGKNENVVTYKISPVLSTPEVSSITGVTVSVKSTLPSGLTYVPNSCNYGEPEINDLGGGVTELTWYINDCTVGEDILPLTYDAKIYDEAPNGMQYTTKAVVFADPNLLGTTPIEKRTSTTTIQIINLSSHRLYKTVQTPVIERNGDIHFTIAYKKNTDGTIPDFQLLDILPYNGDGRGTSYNGNYTLDRIVVTQYDTNGNVIPNSNLRISYTADESVRNGVTSKDSDLADDWTVLNTENVARQVTAFAIIGEMVEQENLRVDVYLKTNGNKGLDKYENNATAQVYRETEEMVTSNVTAQVIYRSIEGIAWKDLNANGLKDANEPLFKNINVSLTDENGNQVTDVEGIVIPSIMTNDDGYYKFEDLPRGNYLVKVTIPDDTYTLTEKEVGSNPVTNSKFNVTSATTDEITKLNSLDLPELTQSNVNAGFVKKPTKVVVNYLEKGTTTKLLPEYTIDGRIDDEYSTTNRLEEVNAANENKYNYDSVDGEVSGFMVEDTIYITYYYVKKDTQVKVLHVEEGTDVSDPETVTDVLYATETLTGKVDDEYNTSNRLTEINNTHTEQYDFVRSTTNTSGTMKVNTVYVIYEYKKAPAVVKVNHLEQGTGTVLSPQETLNGIVGLGYETSNKLDAINAENENKYELVTPEPSNKNGTYAREEQTVTYYYQKKMAEVEVNYVEVGTDTVLADQENMSDRIDEPYTTVNKLDEINAANGNKYEFVRVDGNATGNYTLEKQVITYYYQKKESKVVILHVDTETDITNPATITDVLYPTEEKTGRVDDLYNSVERTNEINASSNYKYALDHIVGNANGNFAVDTIYVIYVYAKQDTVLYIKHVDVITGEELDSITVEGYIGDIVTTREGTFENYRLYEKPSTEEYTLTEEPITVTYYYIRQANVITKYVDELTGNEISTRNFDTYDQNSEYGTVKKDIPEYTYTTDTGNTTGTIGIDDVFVTYYYKKNTSLLVRYIDYYTEEEISPSITMNGIEGQDYETEQKEIDNYVYVDVIGTPAGQMARESQEIIYRYKKQANLITEHIDANTGEKIIPDVIKKYMEKEEYEAYGQNIPGYVLVQEPESKTGVMGREDVTKTFYYKKISGGLIVKYVDVLTGELLDQEVYEGTEGEHIDFDKKHFLYYVLHSTPEVESANLTVEPQEYIYYYIRLGKVPVKGIVQGTGEVLYTYELSGIEGDTYQATPRNVEGYELVVIPDNERGTYQRNTREVVYEYRKIEEEKHGDVIVKYITEDGQELARETDNGLVGETFHFEEKTFEGYEVISRTDSLDGEYIEGTIELVFVLRPVEPTIVEGTIIVKFVDKNGNVLRQEVVSKDLVGEDYYLEAPEIDGYHVVGEDKVRATYVDGELVFEIVYDKDEEIIIDPEPHDDPAPTPTPEPEPQPEEPKTETVDTSDMNMALVLVIAIASISGITLVKKYIKD